MKRGTRRSTTRVATPLLALKYDHWRQWKWNVLYDEVMTWKRIKYEWQKSVAK